MSGILTSARLVCKDKSARETVIEAFHKIIAYTQPHEPEVLQYVCALPLDDSLGTEIYMIEEYANQAASDAHLATKPVQDLIQLFSTSDVLTGPPEVHNCPILLKKSSGSPIAISSNPAIILAQSVAREALQSNAENFVKDVSGANALLVVDDKEAKCLRTEYVLDNWASYEKFLKSTKTMDVTDVVKVKAIAGFLGREDKSKL